MWALLSAILMFAQPWPIVKPVTVSKDFTDASKAALILPISDINGRSLYRLKCYGKKSALSQNEFDYSGDFECSLTANKAIENNGYSTLLTDEPHQDSDWQSRARFFGSELADPCGSVPEFGRERNFYLRGMHIAMHVLNPTFGKDQSLKSFTFKVDVEASLSPRAKRSIAAHAVIDRNWSKVPCHLNNSVDPHFK
ncbi:MAG: hypothetical protein WA738_08310 [Candidatus Angelobacter sp.]